MLHFKRRPSRFVCRFLGSITKSKKPSVYVDGVKESGKGQGSSQTGLNSSKHVVIHITRWSKQGATIISTLLMKTIVIREKLFKTASALLGGSSQKQYPKHSDPTMLANDFGRFFTQKIDDIRSKLDRIDSSSNQPDYTTRSSVQEHSYAGTPFTNFQPIPSEGIKKLVLNAPNKTCDSDPIPT